MSATPDPKHTVGSPAEEMKQALKDFRAIELYRAKDTTTVAQQNRLLNRYLDVVPYDKYIYPSPRESTMYINGSLIECAVDGVSVTPKFVACQAPLPAGMFDFLSTIVSRHITLVLMLTALEENNMPKADRYWPSGSQKGSTLTVPCPDGRGEALVVEHAEDEVVDAALSITRRVLRIRTASASSSSRTFTQVQYTGWPDHGVPDSTKAFGHLIKEIEAYDAAHATATTLSAVSEVQPGKRLSAAQEVSSDAPPVVVHCSAGVGRTGTLIAAYAGVQLAKRTGRTPRVLPTLVLEMRKRRPYMVQRFEQYLYANSVILDHCGADVTTFQPAMNAAIMQYNIELQERIRLMMEAQKK